MMGNLKKFGFVLASVAIINAIPQLKSLSNAGNKYFN